MLPRVAPTTGTAQPSPVLQAGVSLDAATRPSPSAATPANLRADVLLRLIETMLKHMPRTAEPHAGRDLLETLLATLRTLPGGDRESGHKLADLIARLTPDMRPAVERLINTVLSATPTRTLVEILRNPNGPDAQKLATAIAAHLKPELLSAGSDRQQRPVGLTAQQLAAVVRQPMTPQPADHMAGDVRALQSTLKRIFEVETGRPRVAVVQTGEGNTARPSERNRLPVDAGIPSRTETRGPAAAGRNGTEQAVDAIRPALRHMGEAEDLQAPPPAGRSASVGKAQLAMGQVLARSVMQAIARDMPPALLMRAVAQLMETLSPEEANFLRTLLERPFPSSSGQEQPIVTASLPEEAAETANGAKPKLEIAQQPAPLAKPADDAAKPPPPEQARPAVQIALAETIPERLLTALPLRDGVPLAFVPYLPAEDETEWREGDDARQEEMSGEDEADDDGQPGEQDASDTGDGEGDVEPESPDMQRRREKTADMVGAIEPGLVFYQKLGDYWT